MAWGSEASGNQGASAAPPPPVGKRYRAKLDTVAAIAQEMRRVYREARSGILPVEHASKYTNMLALIGRVLEASDLEKRLEALEAAQ